MHSLGTERSGNTTLQHQYRMSVVMRVALGVLPLLCCKVSAEQPNCSSNNAHPQHGWYPVANRNPGPQDPQQPYLIMILMPNNTSNLVPLSQTFLENIWNSMQSPATTPSPKPTVPRPRFRTRTRPTSTTTFTTRSVPQTSTTPQPESSTISSSTPTSTTHQSENTVSSYPEGSTTHSPQRSTSPNTPTEKHENPTASPPSTDSQTSTTPYSTGDYEPRSTTSSHQEYRTSNTEILSKDDQRSTSPPSSSPSPTTSTTTHQHTTISNGEDSITNYEQVTTHSTTPSAKVSTTEHEQLTTPSTTSNIHTSTTNADMSTITVLQTSTDTEMFTKKLSSSHSKVNSTEDYSAEYLSEAIDYDSRGESDCDDDTYYCSTDDPSSDVGDYSYVETRRSRPSKSKNMRTTHPPTTVPTSTTVTYTTILDSVDVVTSRPAHTTTDMSETVVPHSTSHSEDVNSSTTSPTTTTDHDHTDSSTTPAVGHRHSNTSAPDRHHHQPTSTRSPAPTTTTDHDHTDSSTTPAVGHRHSNTSAPDRHHHQPTSTRSPAPTITHHDPASISSTTAPHNITFWPCFGTAPKDSAYQTVSEMLRNNGYQSESHLLRTADKYLLCLHRIPCKSTPRAVVLLQHGIPGSSADWIIAGRNRGLAYLLADAGYDVWMSNSRGNNYSLGHEYLDTRSDRYWSFSMDEMAKYDIPAVIDHILRYTQQSSLYVVTQSTGSAALLAMLSSRPCYNHNIKAAYHLAPAVYLANNTNFLRMHNQPRTGKFTATPELMNHFGTQRCLLHRDAVPEAICRNFRFLVGGYTHCNITKEVLAALLSHSFAGTSEKSYLHYSQILASGIFRQFDYGPLSNLMVYSRKTPPEYDLKLVTAPSSVFYSELDPVVGHREVNWLVHELGNLVEVRHVPYFTHWDFLWGPRATAEVYNHILEEMKHLNQTTWPHRIPPRCPPLSTT